MSCGQDTSPNVTYVLTNVFRGHIFAHMNTIKETVRTKYAEAARNAAAGNPKSCCSDPVTLDLYGSETEGIPEEALLASLGCGNPTLLAELHAGETVLDLGS